MADTTDAFVLFRLVKTIDKCQDGRGEKNKEKRS